MGRSKAPSLPIKALSFCRPTELRGKGGGASHQRGIAFPRPSGRLYGFSCCQRQRHIKLPSEPARSVGRTHRSVRSTRTIEPGRRKAPEPSSPSGLVHKACQPSGIQPSAPLTADSRQRTARYLTHPPDECRGFPLPLCAGGRNRRPRGPEGRCPFFLRSGNGHQ